MPTLGYKRFDDEPKNWQHVTAADLEECAVNLSDTDDELDRSAVGVEESQRWTQSIAPGKYYSRGPDGNVNATKALTEVQAEFKCRVLDKIRSAKLSQPRSEPPTPPTFHVNCSCNHGRADLVSDSSRSSSESDSDEESDKPESDFEKSEVVTKSEVQRKQTHPAGLHPDLCFNEAGQFNEGPACKCSWASKQTGVRHNKFAGETPIPRCNPQSSNLNHLYHYVLRVTPDPAVYSSSPTAIVANGVSYAFEGFSVFFHRPLPDSLPQKPMNRWESMFDLSFVKETAPDNFTVEDLELFHRFVFTEIMELYDLDRGPEDGCPYYHCLPRFVRKLEDNGIEILPTSVVLTHFTDVFHPLIDDCSAVAFYKDRQLFGDFARAKKGQIYLNPDKRPCAIRADHIEEYDRMPNNPDFYPLLTHYGVLSGVYAYSGKPEYQRALKNYLKMRHLLSQKKRPTMEEREQLSTLSDEVHKYKAQSHPKRDATIAVSSRGFYETGIFPDMVQHAMLLVLMCAHARYHFSLDVYEQRISYKFKNRVVLELAFTHPSYRNNYGTNVDHAKNTLSNCGPRLPKLKKAAVDSSQSSRKKGVNALVEIMSKLATKKAVESPVHHNERLEFLGDAAVEFIATIHLYFMFPELEEGGLATYRSSLVQNRHLALMAKKLGLDQFMLYAHGPDLCHEADFRHAMANAFEAMMGAVLLDGGINECDRIFADALYGDDPEMFKVWTELDEHPLKQMDPYGDRHLIADVPCLQQLTEFEDKIGVRFRNIRLLARAFTRRNIGYNNLTLGHNQRMEHLGDTVLQLVTTIYVYKHFPNHQEGHLSMLRTCLVSNRTQAMICDDLTMHKYLVIPKVMQRQLARVQLRLKDKADLVEAFIGALYVDRGFAFCETFCRVCYFPRLKYFIQTQRWNDPKSQLQQCCLTLRKPVPGSPDIPEYKTIGISGPTNTRRYRVAVYFRQVFRR